MANLKGKYKNRFEKTSKTIKTITLLFAVLFFSLFPLWIFKDYSNITKVKYTLFIVLSLLLICYYIFEKGSLILEYGIKRHKTTSYTYIFFGIFALINIISCIISPVVSVINNMGESAILFGSGRCDGLIVLLLYFALFLIFSIEGTFDEKAANVITLTTLIFCVVGFLQMLGYNPFGLYNFGDFYTYQKIFISTIGNIDIVSTFLCTVLPIVSFSFVTSNKKYASVICLSVYIIGVAFLLKLDVDASKITILALLIIAAIILSKNKRYFVRLLYVISASIIGVALSVILNFQKTAYDVTVSFTAPQGLYILLMMALLVTAVAVLMSKYLKEDKTTALKWVVLSLILMLVASFVIYVFVGNFSKESVMYELSQTLKGKGEDKFGSNRLGLWKYTLMLIKERWLVGFGTGTYRSTFSEFTKTLAPKYSNQTYDFAHNDFLQIFYNTGLIGLLSYLGFILSLFKKSIDKLSDNPTIVALMFATMSYLIQSFFIYSIVMVAPLFWILLGCLVYEVKHTKLVI